MALLFQLLRSSSEAESVHFRESSLLSLSESGLKKSHRGFEYVPEMSTEGLCVCVCGCVSLSALFHQVITSSDQQLLQLYSSAEGG